MMFLFVYCQIAKKSINQRFVNAINLVNIVPHNVIIWYQRYENNEFSSYHEV